MSVSGLNETFATRLEAMIAASPHPISISSGFRSVERQQQLWNNALQKYGSEKAARKWVAKPGKSNHNKGLAADLSFGSDQAKDWVHQNAGRFGLFFPMAWEDWHVEPIGGVEYTPEAYTEPPATLEDPSERAVRLMQLALGTPGANVMEPDLAVQFPMDEFGQMFGDMEGFDSPDGPIPSPTAPGGVSKRAAEQRMTGPENVVRLAMQAGFRGQALVTAVAIAWAENNSLNAQAVGDTRRTTSKWGPSMGLWQIRSLKAEHGRGTPRDASKLLNPLYNAKAAYAVSGGGTNFTPWSVFNDDKYRTYLHRAAAAVEAVTGQDTSSGLRQGFTAGRFAR